MKGTVLQKIVDDKLTYLVERKLHQPLASFQSEVQPAQRGFYVALQAKRPVFILECKKASPSKGIIREHFDPVAIARVYGNYAAAISVLTEPDYFQGDFAYLHAVSQSVTVPVLCKDFIFSTYQIDLARYFSADAILLMLSVLSDSDYQRLAAYAADLGLHVLTEVSNEAEMLRAKHLGARIIGINHRDLRDLSVNLNRSQELAPLAPSNALLIAESGISTNAEIRAIAPYVNGFLVGGSLTEQADIDLACRTLIYGEHKVCGMTSQGQAIAARSAGASYAGLIFAKRSKRRVTSAQAEAIRQVPGLRYVGVVSLDDYHGSLADVAQQLAALADRYDLAALQLHDVSDQALLPELAQALTMLNRSHYRHQQAEIWWVQRGDVASTRLHPDYQPLVARQVWDNGHGGSGAQFDWQQLPQQRQHIQLAGGINRANVATALQQQCRGLDINSGVERQPGHKDPVQLQQIFATIRTY